MIQHEPRERPPGWAGLRSQMKRTWMIPFLTFEWIWAWVAFLLSNWSFLAVLEYLGSFSVLIGVILYFSESGDRIKQRHYQAWQVINTAQGKGGSGGRIDALQELNEDGISLIGVDVSSASLPGVALERAKLMRADFSSVDLRGSDFKSADFSYANLRSANLRGSNLENTVFTDAEMNDVDLWESDLTGAHLDGVDLSGADMRYANLKNVHWKQLKKVNAANIANVRNAPPGFIEWALKNGALLEPDGDR